MAAIPTITFDIDGVLANLTRKYVGLLNGFAGTSYTEEWPAVYPVKGMSGSGLFTVEHWELGWQLIDQAPMFWASLEPYEGTPFRKIEALMAEGLMAGYFVSNRHDISVPCYDPRLMTRLWLDEYGISSAQGIIVGQQQRPLLLQLLECDAHLDDHREQATHLRKCGINCYLLTRPWNEGLPFDPAFRVNSVDEFLERAVKPRLAAHAADIFFSQFQPTDLCRIPDIVPLPTRVSLLDGIQISDLAESKSAPRPAC